MESIKPAPPRPAIAINTPLKEYTAPPRLGFLAISATTPFNAFKICQNLKMAESDKIIFLFCSTVKTLYINGFEWQIDL
jgi:hypothetical protein